MPTMRVAIWNIENLGSGWGAQDESRGINSQYLSNFVARFVQVYGIDVLAVLEVFPDAGPHLQMLVQAMNSKYPTNERDWTVDWIKQSFGEPSTNLFSNPDIPQTDGQDNYKQYPLLTNAGTSWFASAITHQARHEGYALFWRANRSYFRVAHNYHNTPALTEGVYGSAASLYPNGALNLVVRGRPLSDQGKPLGGYDTGGGSVYRNGSAPPNWPLLGFPYNSEVYDPFPRMWGARRAAYAVLTFPNVLGNQGDQLCPLIFYHSPASEKIAGRATACCAMARELFRSLPVDNVAGNPPTLQVNQNTVHIEKVIVGGDFNYGPKGDPQDPWPGHFVYFTANSGQGADTGADCATELKPTAGDDYRTAVRLSRRIAGSDKWRAIEDDDPNAYLGDALDNVFHRGLGATSRRVNLVADLTGPRSDDFANVLKEFGQITNRIMVKARRKGEVTPTTGPIKVKIGGGSTPLFGQPDSRGGGFTDFKYAKLSLKRGRLASGRPAAEFVRKFISDHLPLIVEFNV